MNGLNFSSPKIDKSHILAALTYDDDDAYYILMKKMHLEQKNFVVVILTYCNFFLTIFFNYVKMMCFLFCRPWHKSGTVLLLRAAPRARLTSTRCLPRSSER